MRWLLLLAFLLPLEAGARGAGGRGSAGGGVITQTVQTDDFRSYTGPGANSQEKLVGRIATIQSALEVIL